MRVIVTRSLGRTRAAGFALLLLGCEKRHHDVTTLQVLPVSTTLSGPDDGELGLVPTPSQPIAPQSLADAVLPSSATSGAALQAEPPSDVCSLVAEPGAVGSCVRLGSSAFRVWGAERSGKMPKALAVDHSGKYLYSSNMGSDGEQGLSVFRTDPLRLERHVAISGNAIELFVSNDDRWLWFTDAAAWGKIKRYDVQSWHLDREIGVPGFPKWMITDRAHSNIYVSLWTWDGVSKVDMHDGAVRTLKTRRGKASGRHSKNPRGLALSKDEQELYVLNNHDHTLSIVDVGDWSEKERVQIGYAPRHIVAAREGETFFVSLTGEDAVLEWEPKRRTVRRRFAVGKRPKTIALSGDGRFVFVANFVGNSVSIVEVASGESRELPLHLHKPSGLAVRSDDRFVYVSGFCTNEVWAIERIDDGNLPTPTLGQGFKHRPCMTCASTFAGCPFPPGKAPNAVGDEPVKTDAEWGWSIQRSR